ncbi:TetR family transcriptional regulator [Cellulomonas sp. JZ18]|uniref:TetR/AcrR family transcriptional regulator n=1 Tax=Cellulomonas sp. JZ18 TaxID=2654191 RepID=UPI0012D44864|nr:TetR/AcrR family transcriptional regulator C-terminal domain-containing protein [Cellulomonas sp. JZ18]QGQ19848.1 TetR family transcriptional regulator [Cellulomonas sp. JZ18]
MPTRSTAARARLTRERVLETARDLADREGLDALTMRRLAEALGVEAMSLYHHVPNKDAILDGLVELVFTEIEAEVGGFGSTSTPGTWRGDLRARVLGARRVLLRHPWLPGLLEARAVLAPTMARYVDGVVGLMRDGGLSYDLVHHALHALGSRMYGFTQELRLDDPDGGATEIDPALLAMVPNLAGMLAEVVHDDPGSTLGWCDDQSEFEFGLDLLLDGLERLGRR